MYRKFFASVLVAGVFSSVSAFGLTAQQKVEREVTTINPDGTHSITLERADKVTPGDTVVYSIDYYNDDDKPAENIVLVMPVPVEIEFLEGSATAQHVETVYSADGGKSFAARKNLMIVDAGGNQALAQSADLTHIRWTVLEPIASDTGGTLSFSGRLK